MTGTPDTIHQRGRAALLAGREVLDVPPAPGGARWGLSLVIRPDQVAEDRLSDLTDQVGALAGPGQWSTGSRGAAHLTVTYLEAHPPARRGATTPRYGGSPASCPMSPPGRHRCAGSSPASPWPSAGCSRWPSRWTTPRTRSGRPCCADLGDLGRREASYRRGTWWSTLLHFAAPVADRRGLADWVQDGSGPRSGSSAPRRLDIVRYEHDGERVVPVTLASAALPAVPEEA